MAVPGAAYAHAGQPPAPHDLLTEWRPDAGSLVVILMLALLYARGVSVLWSTAGRGRSISKGRSRAGALGIVALSIALLSPLDLAASALFSLHMIQHLLLMLIAAPLLVIGRIHLALLWSLPPRARRTLGRAWAASPRFRRIALLITMPATAWTLHAFALWLWHAPRPYDAAASSDAWHALEHASFIVTALLFAIPLEKLWRVSRRGLSHGWALLYVFGAAMQSGALGALLALSEAPWYSAHSDSARLWGLTPLEDQQLAGALMWGPASAVYLAVVILLARLWLERAGLPREKRLRPAATSEA